MDMVDVDYRRSIEVTSHLTSSGQWGKGDMFPAFFWPAARDEVIKLG